MRVRLENDAKIEISKDQLGRLVWSFWVLNVPVTSC